MRPAEPIVIDNFTPIAHQLREDALASEFIDWEGHDGEIYRRVCIKELPGIQYRIERVMGSVKMMGMGYRLNFNSEPPNAAIHSDLGWGTHALVLYLSEGEGGTAFWRHKMTGLEHLKAGQVAEWEAVRDDWNSVDAWTMTNMVDIKFNRAVIYDGSRFHSRWPFEAFGTDAQSGRLIAVAFFTPESVATP